MSGERPTLYCSFCAKTQHEVKRLIAGPTVFICDECVVRCNWVLLDGVRVMTPSDLGLRDSALLGSDYG